MKPRNSALSCLALIWLASTAFGADFQAKVIHVTDGDTITVLNDTNEQIKIRLNGIDCPEKAQAYGKKAKTFTKDLVAGEMVTIKAHETDRYGRTIGNVVLEDGRNLSQELVKVGYAWWYRKYAPEDMVLKTLEAEAREAKTGLWKDSNPIPPWIFRNNKKQHTGKPFSPDSHPVQCESPLKSTQRLPILGNKRSKKYHRPDCPSYDLVSHKNQIPFESAKKASDAGYTLAGNCP